MNPRERILASVIGAALALVVIYYGINYLFINPLRNADVELTSLTQEQREIDGKMASREVLAARWVKYVGQTFDPADALDRFGVDLKEICKRHGFEGAVFQPSTGSLIGPKTKIKTVAHRISVDGTFPNVISFLRDIYQTPYMNQITKLSIIPQEAKAGRNMVRVELTVETPVLPQVDKKKIPEVAVARTMGPELEKTLPPFREHLLDDDAYQVLTERNIFRAYEPPPSNIVMIENQDWKDVVAHIAFSWEDKASGPPIIKAIPKKGSVSIEGKGDVAEVQGSYADGESFGPKRFEFGTKKDWVYQVAAHHPPPPPEVIDLAVDNKDSATIQLEVRVNGKDGKSKTEPTMIFEPGRFDVREYKDVTNLTVTAKYASGKPASPQTFTPSVSKLTYTVPPEPAEAVAVTPQQAPVADSPPDPTYTVTALLTYEEVQEMVASSQTSDRKVIRAGEAGAVDGGTLLAVHPLGGVVKMPTGNFYIYPLGRKFTQRVKLAAANETELPEAIDRWSRE
ncbi:MAG TPA: hypothetical protein VMV94_21585 [Phycisphaerae bacterium]|nr:hypothetical protein [Phycisphaerae bacterium]